MSKVERGERRIDDAEVVELAAALSVDPHELLVDLRQAMASELTVTRSRVPVAAEPEVIGE